jgi:hypothetical protein
MRRGESFEQINITSSIAVEIVRAADYSYQAFGYSVNGWTNDLRRKRFYKIFWRVVTARGELPF